MGNSRYSPCCCLPNRFGAAVVAILTTVGSGLLLAGLIYIMVEPESQDKHAFYYHKFNGTTWYVDSTRSGIDPIYGGILLSTLIFTFLVSFLLLLGVILASPCLVKPWIYFTGLFIVTLWITLFAIFFLQFVMYQQVAAFFLYLGILALVILVSYYYVFIVYAYYDEIKYNY